MSPVRGSLGLLGALFAMVMVAATASAQTPAEQQAAAVALAVVGKASGVCGATIDQSRTRVQASDPLRATIVRPSGFDVTVSGTEGSKYSARNDYNSQWLVANGQAYPQNIAAARLATGCGGEAPSNPATPLDWHRLTHLDSYSGDIQIGRPGFQGAVLNPALRKQIGDAGPLAESQAPVWAAKCKAGGQFVEFVRYVELLGPPASLRVYVGWAAAGLRRDPIDGMGVYVNGTQVATLFKRGILDVEFDERARNLIQFGRNRISIVAHKEKTGTCNKKGGKRQVGLTFLIKGKQAWQTTVTRPPPAVQGNVLTPIQYTVTNLGPSVLLEPVLTVSMSVRSLDLNIVGPNGSGEGAACTTNDARLTAVCALEPMAAGATKSVGIVFAAGKKDRPPGDTSGEYTPWQVDWNFMGATGLASGSYCIPPAGKADCKTLGG